MIHFPFTAIVGQESLKRALLVNAVNPAVGGVLVQGPPGTGKSTAVRGLAELMPEIDVVADCPFSCSPLLPCGSCNDRRSKGETLPEAKRPVRVVDLPLNATEDRIAGTLDIARALRQGVKALEPGLLADANRGILYVDEINLLDDHLSDVILDAAALGVNLVEREGVSVAHPAHFILIGTMNPEEGDLRPQLADRIGLDVEVAPLTDIRLRAEVVRRREAFTADPTGFVERWRTEQEALAESIRAVSHKVGDVRVPDELYEGLAGLALRLGVGSHRADVTILQCAKALAALARRDAVGSDDVVGAADLAFGHRLPADPFGPAPEVSRSELERALEEMLASGVEPKKAPGATPASPRAST